MKFDPSLSCTTYTVNLPPSVGPGSGKAAWKALAHEELNANANLTAVIEQLRETIRDHACPRLRRLEVLEGSWPRRGGGDHCGRLDALICCRARNERGEWRGS